MTNNKQFDPVFGLLNEPAREHSPEEVKLLLAGTREAWNELGGEKRSIFGEFLSRLQSDLSNCLINHPEILDQFTTR